jgi:cell division septation protein DedD
VTNRGNLRLAVLALAAVILAGVAFVVDRSGNGQADAIATTAGEVTTTLVAPPTTDAAPTTTIVKVPIDRPLQVGVVGDDVRRMQQRLVDLRFDPGGVDGQFGPGTQSAVWAFQKAIGIPIDQVDGVVTPALWDRMQDPFSLPPRRTNASRTHMEVYLPNQLAVVYTDNVPTLITHVSTGSGQEWCEAGKCGVSITPAGVYRFYRKEKDWWEGDLGRMYNPVYFNYGVAVHGLSNVPDYPASHGCVRIPMHIAEYFPELVQKGDMIFVFDGIKEPEEYGSPPPPFDTVDPNATTTTTSTSTTSTTSTTAPTTTTPSTTRATTAPPPTAAPTTPASVPPPTTVATTAAPTTPAPAVVDPTSTTTG